MQVCHAYNQRGEWYHNWSRNGQIQSFSTLPLPQLRAGLRSVRSSCVPRAGLVQSSCWPGWLALRIAAGSVGHVVILHCGNTAQKGRPWERVWCACGPRCGPRGSWAGPFSCRWQLVHPVRHPLSAALSPCLRRGSHPWNSALFAVCAHTGTAYRPLADCGGCGKWPLPCAPPAPPAPSPPAVTSRRSMVAPLYLRPTVTPYTWAEKFGSFERINSIRETNGNFDSCNSCKRLMQLMFRIFLLMYLYGVRDSISVRHAGLRSDRDCNSLVKRSTRRGKLSVTVARWGTTVGRRNGDGDGDGDGDPGYELRASHGHKARTRFITGSSHGSSAAIRYCRLPGAQFWSKSSEHRAFNSDMPPTAVQ